MKIPGGTSRFARTTDPWRLLMPVPRYLRNSPLRTMRERLWFVSRIEPVVNVSLNLFRNVRVEQTAAAVPANVVLNRWMATRTTSVEVRHRMAESTPQTLPTAPGMRLTPRTALRITDNPAAASVRLPARNRPEPVDTASAPETVVLRRLADRAIRIEETGPALTVKVVRKAAARPSAETTPFTAPERQAWGQPPRSTGYQPMSPGTIPASPAAPAVNVDHLTEQVIRQLDRRLIASRERMGRT